MTKYKNKNFENLVRPNEDIQVLTITDADATFKKHYPLGTIISCFYNDHWYLLTLAQEVGPSDTLRNVAKTQLSTTYVDNRPRGAELVVNGDFATDLSGWTNDGPDTVTWDAGSAANYTCGALGTAVLWQAQNLTVGAEYALEVVTLGGEAGSVRVSVAGEEYILDDIGGETLSTTFIAENGNDLYVISVGTCTNFLVDSVSLKKLI